ncbi:MAG: hypothetical protein AAF439_08615 [Pseudomonadota bacterium]
MKPVRAFRRLVGEFWSDRNGSMTIEFMMWIPILMLTAVFIIGAFMAMSSRLQALMNTSTLHHIISKQEEINTTFLNDLGNMMEEMAQDASGTTEVRFSGIKFDGVAHEVVWTECIGGIAALETDDIPVEILPVMANEEHVILVETYVPYSPITYVLGLEDFVWSSVKFVKSRDVPKVTSTWEGLTPPSGTCTIGGA